MTEYVNNFISSTRHTLESAVNSQNSSIINFLMEPQGNITVPPSPVSKKAAFRKFAAENQLMAITVPQNQKEREWDEIFKDFQDLSKPLTLSESEIQAILNFYGISDINRRDPDRKASREEIDRIVSMHMIPLRSLTITGSSPLENAIAFNNVPLVRLLLSQGASPIKKRYVLGVPEQIPYTYYVSYTTPISDAILTQDLSLIQQFVKSGFNPHTKIIFEEQGIEGAGALFSNSMKALEFAQTQENDSIVALILEASKNWIAEQQSGFLEYRGIKGMFGTISSIGKENDARSIYLTNDTQLKFSQTSSLSHLLELDAEFEIFKKWNTKIAFAKPPSDFLNLPFFERPDAYLVLVEQEGVCRSFAALMTGNDRYELCEFLLE